MMSKLPIFKHFNGDSITNQVDKFRTGEKGLFWFVKLAALGAIGYGLWVYVLPTVFAAIAQTLAFFTVGVMILGLALAAPVVLKGLRRFTRFLHKSVIRHDPFAELEEQRNKMIQNQQKFRAAKGKISGLKQEMEIEASKNEELAKDLQKTILNAKSKATKMKAQMDDLVAKHGKAAQGTDEYINLYSEFTKLMSMSQRYDHQLKQAQEHTEKYGSRANVMMKFGQKMIMVETNMDIKVLDFDATIEILKKDWEFAKKSKEATQTAKDAMLFTKDWELEYALDYVTSTIASDIAITAGNLNDIESLTTNFNMDNDDMFASLELLGNDIESGANKNPVAKKFSNTNYDLTHDEKIKSGGFGDIF